MVVFQMTIQMIDMYECQKNIWISKNFFIAFEDFSSCFCQAGYWALNSITNSNQKYRR